MLEEYAKPAPGRTPNQQKIGDYFAACMDEAAIEKAARAAGDEPERNRGSEERRRSGAARGAAAPGFRLASFRLRSNQDFPTPSR